MSAVGALGAALTSIGRSKEDRRKEELAIKLEKEKEESRRAWEESKQARADRREDEVVAQTKTITKPDGSIVEQDFNKRGKPLGPERAADPMRLKQIKMEEDKDKASLEAVLTQTAEGRKRISFMDEDQAIQRGAASIQSRVAEAQIRNYDEPNSRDKETPEPSLSDATNALVKDMGDLKESYTDIDAATFRKIAQESVKQAAARGQDAGVIFEDALRRYGKPRIKGK